VSDVSAGEAAGPTKKRSGLGRGLSALLGEIEREAPVAADASQASGVRMMEVAALRPLPGQPRRHFDEASLDELAESIRSRGMLQPIVVRPVDGQHQIVAGERRWRAAQRAQLHQVPVIVKEFDDRMALEMALIENIQREQLNALEEGETYRRLIEDFGHSQEALCTIVGKSRSHIVNLMRLRDLPLRVHGFLAAGQLTMGHARALLTTDDPEGIAKQVIAKGLSVRQTEALVRRSKPGAKPKRIKAEAVGDADIVALERQLADLLGLKVTIRHELKSGLVTLHYSTLEQLDMICQRLTGEAI
jgi:ParB family transcriptional regulator, chromosome partitioning protein